MSRRERELDPVDPKEPGPAAPAQPAGDGSGDAKAAINITFVTGNAGKLSEVTAMLAKDPACQVTIDNKGVDLPELQGEPRDIAAEKARTAFKLLQRPCIVEDTSLCCLALGDGALPGPYIRDFLKHLGHDGLNKILAGFGDNRAYAQCIFAVAFNEKEVELFQGRCYGHIVPARGPSGFGWDPVFEPNDDGKEHHKRGNRTFAEMSKDEKNEISHRRRGLDQLVEFLSSL